MKTNERGAAEWQELLAKKEDEITALRRQVEWLTQQLRLVRGQRFGASSEKTQALLDPMEQVSLFNETESLEDRCVPELELEQVTYKRKKQKGKREMDFSGLPVEQIVHELSGSARSAVSRCMPAVIRFCAENWPMYRRSTRWWNMYRPHTAAAIVSGRAIMCRWEKARYLLR